MFHHVIAGVDGRPAGQDAIALARLLGAPDAHLGLAHVYERTLAGMGSYAIGAADVEADRADATRLLEEARATAGVDAGLTALGSSSIGRGLHQIAARSDTDLLVVGSCRRAFAGRVFAGNDTRAVLHGAPCAVAIAPLGYAQAPGPITTIGVAYNESPESEAALALARDLAAVHGAAVRAVEVVEMPTGAYGWDAGVVLTDALAGMLAAAETRTAALEGVEGTAVAGLAAHELAAFSGQVDLLIAGSRGYGPLRSLILGSTSAYLVSHARCPLLVVPRSALPEPDPA